MMIRMRLVYKNQQKLARYGLSLFQMATMGQKELGLLSEYIKKNRPAFCPITFPGVNAWLSNHQFAPFTIGTQRYACSEIYFQSQKFNYLQDKLISEILPQLEHLKSDIIKCSTGKEATQLARDYRFHIKEKILCLNDLLHPDWHIHIKFSVLQKANLEKFKQNPQLRKKLFETGNAALVALSTKVATHSISIARNKQGILGNNNFGKIVENIRSILKFNT